MPLDDQRGQGRAWSPAPCTSCIPQVRLVLPAEPSPSTEGQAAHGTFPQSQGHARLSQEGKTQQMGWPRSGRNGPRHVFSPVRGLEDAGLTFLFYPFPFMQDESVNLWQLPPPSQILPSVVRKHVFNEHPLGPSSSPSGTPSLWLVVRGSMRTKVVVDPGMPGCCLLGRSAGGLSYPGEEVENGYRLLPREEKAGAECSTAALQHCPMGWVF